MSSIEQKNPNKSLIAQVMSKAPTSEVLELMVEYLDGQADLALMSNAKQEEEFYRQLAVYLFDAWKKVGAAEELREVQ